jgi:hypothetical protein
MTTKVSNEEFVRTWQELQSATAVAAKLGLGLRNVNRRRRSLEAETGKPLVAVYRNSPVFTFREHSPRVECDLPNGTIIVASDAHYWPGVISTAHKALLTLIPELQPSIVVMNGDLFDGAAISRFPRSDWSKVPSVKDELDAVRERLAEIEAVTPAGAKRWWCMGNHDMRFEAKLAGQVPEYEGVAGFSIKDHFPGWDFSISLFVNKSLMIKHRYRNGVHATWNNALYGGVSMCTGHLHRLQATILSDYKGPRWGIDCGTLAEASGEHMHYGEDNPTNHCSGFAVLTIADGQLLHPEFCSVIAEKAYFRGKAI